MKKSRFWQIALPIGIVLWTAFIWSQSLMTAAESTINSSRVAALISRLFHLDPDTYWLTYAVRKTAHFTEFAILGLLWGGCNRVYPWRRLWLCGLATGAVDECLQFFAPGRAPMVTDVLIDTAGYLCGVAVIGILAHLCRKKIK